MRFTIKGLAACIVALSSLVVAQAVSVNSPTPWSTLREPLILINCQIDTSKTQGKKIQFSIFQVSAASEKKVTTKSFPVTDYSQQFELGSIIEKYIGGESYLKISWEIPKTEFKGAIEPIGISLIQDSDSGVTAQAFHASAPLTIEAASALTKSNTMVTVGDQKCAFVWDQNSLYIIISRVPGSENKLMCAIDGKNGKNAFLSFPDRIISYTSASDSVVAQYFKRTHDKNGIRYLEQFWVNEIKKNSNADIALITVPWYDLGMIPFADRIIGFAVFSLDAQGAFLGQLPSGAKRDIPGTWGNMALRTK